MNAIESPADKRWRDEFIIRLRFGNVPGPVIGDALKTVTTHTAETGESFEEAFGNAREYADSLGLNRPTPASTYLVTIPACAGVMFLISGLLALIRGTQAEISWVNLATGAATIVGALLVVRAIGNARRAHRSTLLVTVLLGVGFVVGAGILAIHYGGNATPIVSVHPAIMIGASVLVEAYLVWDLRRSGRQERIADPISGADISGVDGKWAVIAPIAVPVVLLLIVVVIGLAAPA